MATREEIQILIETEREREMKMEILEDEVEAQQLDFRLDKLKMWRQQAVSYSNQLLESSGYHPHSILSLEEKKEVALKHIEFMESFLNAAKEKSTPNTNPLFKVLQFIPTNFYHNAHAFNKRKRQRQAERDPKDSKKLKQTTMSCFFKKK